MGTVVLLGTPGGVRMTVSGGRIRWLLVGTSLAGGLLIALLTIHLEAPWDAGFIGDGERSPVQHDHSRLVSPRDRRV